ncbi:uncharacterized protein LOC143845183 isoform X4 [Paroedura picta]|uniref:uncharacterized protein LOC143845183 isoform X4 n=1 Tax=Paroedura picta TaxID=143630 RepID=UPI0040572FDE
MAQIQVARRAKARSAAAPSWQHHHAGNEVTALSAGHLLFSARRPAAVLPRRSGAVPGLFSSRDPPAGGATLGRVSGTPFPVHMGRGEGKLGGRARLVFILFPNAQIEQSP